MRLSPPSRKKPEPTITVINVVFLMLIFFLVAGHIAAPIPHDIRRVQICGREAVLPPDVLAISASGKTLWQGVMTSPADFVVARPAGNSGIVRLMPDRDLPAARLIEVAQALRHAGAREVRLVAERAGS